MLKKQVVIKVKKKGVESAGKLGGRGYMQQAFTTMVGRTLQ